LGYHDKTGRHVFPGKGVWLCESLLSVCLLQGAQYRSVFKLGKYLNVRAGGEHAPCSVFWKNVHWYFSQGRAHRSLRPWWWFGGGTSAVCRGLAGESWLEPTVVAVWLRRELTRSSRKDSTAKRHSCSTSANGTEFVVANT
jgi:hypothetical protein